MSDINIKDFIKLNQNLFFFNIPDEQKEKISSNCAEVILNSKIQSTENLTDALECMKILSRDASMETYLCKEEMWTKLLELSDIYQYDEKNNENILIINHSIIVVDHAIKVLCNMTKNFYFTIPVNLEKFAVTGILNRIKLYEENSLESTINIKIFEMKLLFLLTALFSETRYFVVVHYDCLHRLSAVMESHLNNIKNLSLDEVLLDCEILKCLFNVLYQSADEIIERKVEKEMNSLLHCLKNLAVEINLLGSIPENIKVEFISNTANLLTSIPDSSFQYLLFPSNNEIEENLYKDPESLRYIQLVLDLIERRLNENTHLLETLAPLMHAMGKGCLAERNIRKYCRLKVLPYMKKEVMELPEHGDSIRNKLCKLLQHPCEQVTESVAFFLFILCKEDVERAIKYTGFGNFAGFLARHALLSRSKNQDNIGYSDSEDSDTEEYLNIRDRVNPVTGRVEENHLNQFEDMTDEQKEYEVVRLMNQIDLLQKQGIIKPGLITEDGGVRPVESVLELVEKAKSNKIESEQENRSSDDE